MNLFSDCYSKVKKDCFKYIRSQEISNEKFKNKEKMLKQFLIPLSFWINKKKIKGETLFVGLAGGQGSGKTTISTMILLILKKYFKMKVFKISIDDFYKTREERIKMSKKIHPMLKTRGVPGTHDVNLILKFFKNIEKIKFKKFSLPKFDKSIDDRCKKKLWYQVKDKPDIVILEGWCVGARASKKYELKKPLNVLEANLDKNKKWRNFVNLQLNKSYKKLFSQLNLLIYLKAKNFRILKEWRLKQEKKLRIKFRKNKSSKIMSKEEVLKFMMTYQRITEQMFKSCPKYCSAVLFLNNKQQIQNLKMN